MHPVIHLLLSSITTDWAWLLIFTRFLDHTQDAPQSVGLLWTSDQFVADTSTWQHTTITTDKHPCPPTCWGFLFTLKNPTASNPRTWVPKASTLPLDHRSRCRYMWEQGYQDRHCSYSVSLGPSRVISIFPHLSQQPDRISVEEIIVMAV